jgi:hypothetical protein
MPSFSMTSSETQTEAEKGRGGRKATRPSGWLELAVGLVLLAAGWLPILIFNHWHLTAPVIFLALGWLGVLLCGRFFWTAALSAGNEGLAPDDDGFELSVGRVAELQREKRALLKAIKEVEFDRAMGKMSEADAAEITRVYRARAIDILKELEGQGEGSAEGDEPLEKIIEREVRARLALAGVSAKRKPAASATATASGSAPADAAKAEPPAVEDADQAPDQSAQSATGKSEVERREDA